MGEKRMLVRCSASRQARRESSSGGRTPVEQAVDFGLVAGRDAALARRGSLDDLPRQQRRQQEDEQR